MRPQGGVCGGADVDDGRSGIQGLEAFREESWILEVKCEPTHPHQTLAGRVRVTHTPLLKPDNTQRMGDSKV